MKYTFFVLFHKCIQGFLFVLTLLQSVAEVPHGAISQFPVSRRHPQTVVPLCRPLCGCSNLGLPQRNPRDSVQPHPGGESCAFYKTTVCLSLYCLSESWSLSQVKSHCLPESARVLALLCLGEVGRNGSLGGSKEVQTVIIEAFSSSSEEVTLKSN